MGKKSRTEEYTYTKRRIGKTPRKVTVRETR